MTPITNEEALLIIGSILLAGLIFGLVIAYISGTFPFKRIKY